MIPSYATLDQVTLGSALELRDGGFILTYDTAGASLSRNARCTQALTSGKHYWEVIVYNDGTATASTQVADTAAVGLVIDSTGASDWPGNAATTVAYRPGDGALWQNGASVATGPIAPLRTVVGFALDLDSGTKTLQVRVNRLLVHTFTLPTGQTWRPAVSIGGAVAYGFGAFVNFGLRAFEHSVPSGYREGVYTLPQPFSTIRIASEDWITPVSASPPNVQYDGCVRNAKDLATDFGVTFWVHGERSTSSAVVDLHIDNQDGRYDSLVDNPPRDARVTFKIVDRDNPAGSPVTVATALFDRVDGAQDDVIVVKLRDVLSQLRLPAQKNYFLPYVADGAQGRPRQMLFGACRNVDPILVDPITREHALHDDRLTQVAAVRDRGDRLDPLASPADYTYSNDQRGIVLQTDPVGKLTADVSSSGLLMIVGAPDIDVLAGYGAMTTNVSGMPDQWVTVSTTRATASRVATDGGRLLTSSIDGLPGADPVFGWDVRFRDMRSARDWVPIRKRCLYRITFKIRAVLWPANNHPNQFSGGWYVRGAGQVSVAGTVGNALSVGEYTMDFRAEHDGTLAWFGGGFIDPNGDGPGNPGDGPWWAELDDVVCLLKSAETPDLLEGYGNFVTALSQWTAGAASAGCSVAHGTHITTEFPSPGLGVASFTVASGASKSVELYFSKHQLVADQQYRIAFSMAGSSSNSVVQLFAWDNTTDDYFLLGTYSGATAVCETTASVGTDLYLLLRASTSDSLAGTIKVSQVRALDITDQLNESAVNVPLDGITLTDYYREIIERRARLGSSAWVSADCEAIDAATRFVFGVYAREAVTSEALLRAPLDSFLAALTSDEEGRVRVVRLRAPELADDAEIVLDIDGINSPEPPTIVPDDAPGLTCRAGARRNWTQHGDSDFVDDLDPLTGIDAATRSRFKRLSQYLVASGLPLAPLYAHARDAGQIETLLDMPEHAQQLIDEACGLFAVTRKFVRCTVYYDGAPPAARPGAIVRYTRDRFGFNAGKKLLIMRARHLLLARAFQIVAWG